MDIKSKRQPPVRKKTPFRKRLVRPKRRNQRASMAKVPSTCNGCFPEQSVVPRIVCVYSEADGIAGDRETARAGYIAQAIRDHDYGLVLSSQSRIQSEGIDCESKFDTQPLIRLPVPSPSEENIMKLVDIVDSDCSSEGENPLICGDQNMEVCLSKGPSCSFQIQEQDQDVNGCEIRSPSSPSPRAKMDWHTSDSQSQSNCCLLTVESEGEDTVSGEVCGDENHGSVSSHPKVESCSPMSPVAAALMEKVRLNLLQYLPTPAPWIVIMRKNGISVCLLSPSPKVVVVQRSLLIEPTGKVYAAVHGKPLHPDHNVMGDQIVPLCEETVENFTKDILCLVHHFRGMEVCKGVEEFQHLWKTVEGCEIDTNKFLENRFKITCRPDGCHMLVPSLKHKRCRSCYNVWMQLKKRQRSLLEGIPVTSRKKKRRSSNTKIKRI